MKLAICVSDLGASQLNHSMIPQVNSYVSEHPTDDISALFESMALPCLPLQFSASHIIEGHGHTGILVATTLSTFEKCVRFPCYKGLIFYSFDMEWMRLPMKSFRKLRRIYGDLKVPLVARCKDHAKIMSHAWNREVPVVEDCNIEELVKIAKELE